MVQAAGALLVLIGAVAWHIASSGKVNGIADIWNDFLKTMQGKAL